MGLGDAVGALAVRALSPECSQRGMLGWLKGGSSDGELASHLGRKTPTAVVSNKRVCFHKAPCNHKFIHLSRDSLGPER